MEVTKWLKPSECGSRIGDRASVQAATRVNAEQASHDGRVVKQNVLSFLEASTTQGWTMAELQLVYRALCVGGDLFSCPVLRYETQLMKTALIFSLQPTAMPVLVTEAELLSRRELRPPTSHPAGPASAPLSRIRAKRSSKRAAPFSKTEQCCPRLASVAAPSDRSGASHAYSVSIVIAFSVDRGSEAALLRRRSSRLQHRAFRDDAVSGISPQGDQQFARQRNDQDLLHATLGASQAFPEPFRQCAFRLIAHPQPCQFSHRRAQALVARLADSLLALGAATVEWRSGQAGVASQRLAAGEMANKRLGTRAPSLSARQGRVATPAPGPSAPPRRAHPAPAPRHVGLQAPRSAP